MDRILVAEDDPIILEMIKILLNASDLNPDVVTAVDGLVAKNILEKDQNFQLILSDWMMPHVSGIELLRWAKENESTKNLPFVLVTALDDVERVREGIDSGAFYYLTKPFRKEVLMSVVKSAIADYKQKEELLRKVRESDNPVKNLSEASFKFRTLHEGEFLAAGIARLTSNPSESMFISELLANAVEHGLADISYEEKTKLLMEGRLNDEIEKRTSTEEKKDWAVEVSFKKSGSDIWVTIKDPGKGFDFPNYLTFDESRVFDSHGRGIAIASCYMQLEYHGDGNEVVVKLPLQAHTL